MSGFSAVDLSKITPPAIIEQLDFEVITTAMKANLIERDTNYAQVLALESEPLVKQIENFAYREMDLRARINDAAKATMLAFAKGSDLDHIGGKFQVKRQIVTPATDDTQAIYETDERYRQRIQLSFEGYTNAGSIGAYTFFGLSADPRVADIDVYSPEPGTVNVTVLDTENNGIADQALLDTVYSALNADEIRPLCDTVVVQVAKIIDYKINATMYFYGDLDRALIKQQALARAELFATEHYSLGHNIHLSALHAAIHFEGVQRVDMGDMVDILISPQQAARCVAINLQDGGIDE